MFGFVPLSATAISDATIASLVSASGNIVASGTVSATGFRQLSFSGAISSRAVVTAQEGAIQGSASILCRATITASGGYVKDAVASINGTATITAIGFRERQATASIACLANITAIASNVIFADVYISGNANVSINPTVIKSSAIASIVSFASISALGRIYGEEWTKNQDNIPNWQIEENEIDLWTKVERTSTNWLNMS